jgi:hypothetical protein
VERRCCCAASPALSRSFLVTQYMAPTGTTRWLPTCPHPQNRRYRRTRVIPRLAEQRLAAERRCRAALADRPPLLAEFEALLAVNQRYAVIREEQALTLAWPALWACAVHFTHHLASTGLIGQPDDVFFCTPRRGRLCGGRLGT